MRESTLYSAYHNTLYKIFLHEGVNHEDRQRGQNRDSHPDSLRRDGIGYQLIHTCCICGVLDLVCQSLHFIEVIIKQICKVVNESFPLV